MGNIDILDLVSHLLIYMVVLVLAISVHEAGHAWVSYKNGDDTAYMLGRVTINPVAHTDPIGTLLIPMISFIFGAMGGAMASIPLIGWGKPTPVNPRKWRNYKLGNVTVSVAGVVANFILLVAGFVAAKIMMSQGFVIGDFFGQIVTLFTGTEAIFFQGSEMFLGFGQILGQQISLADVLMHAEVPRVYL